MGRHGHRLLIATGKVWDDMGTDFWLPQEKYRTTWAQTFDCHRKSMESWVGTKQICKIPFPRISTLTTRNITITTCILIISLCWWKTRVISSVNKKIIKFRKEHTFCNSTTKYILLHNYYLNQLLNQVW
jgi:hypothetical protein